MHLSGKTPLFRARNLEEALGIERIHLKLEGSNPTGHKNDRVAESLVKYYRNTGVQDLIINGSDNFLKSMEYFASVYGIGTRTALVKEDNPLYPAAEKSLLLKSKNRGSILEELKGITEGTEAVYVSEWEDRPFIKSISVSNIIEEITPRVPALMTVYTQANLGNTVTGMFQDLMRDWLSGDIEMIPEIMCAVVPGSTFQPEGIMERYTRTIDIDRAELRKAADMLLKYEGITVSEEGAYPFAAFLRQVPSEGGDHVVVLNDGFSDTQVVEVDRRTVDEDEVKSLTGITHGLLMPFNDSLEETEDAIRTALRGGFILKSLRGGEVNGICVVVPTGFDDFIPSYHLAYIGVREGNSGRGIATTLINSAVEKTEGNLSLHVDMNNPGARKLYEKIGFVHKYERMIYGGKR